MVSSALALGFWSPSNMNNCSDNMFCMTCLLLRITKLGDPIIVPSSLIITAEVGPAYGHRLQTQDTEHSQCCLCRTAVVAVHDMGRSAANWAH